MTPGKLPRHRRHCALGRGIVTTGRTRVIQFLEHSLTFGAFTCAMNAGIHQAGRTHSRRGVQALGPYRAGAC